MEFLNNFVRWAPEPDRIVRRQPPTEIPQIQRFGAPARLVLVSVQAAGCRRLDVPRQRRLGGFSAGENPRLRGGGLGFLYQRQNDGDGCADAFLTLDIERTAMLGDDGAHQR